MSLDIAKGPAALRRRTLMAYGIGDMGTGMAASLVGFYLFVFYTSVASLPAWLAGTVLMVVRIWDVISDQLIGWLGDSTKHRLGPRIPWMFWCALPLGVSMALMWWVPPFADPWRFLWFVLIASLFQATYSGVNLPYAALATELTESTPLRTRLNTARFTGSVMASLAGLLLGALLTHQGLKGYWWLGCIAGGMLVISSLLSAIGLTPAARICRRPQHPRSGWFNQMRALVPNRRFRKVVLLYLLLWSALQLMQPVAIIFLTNVMHLPHAWSTALLIPFQLSALIGLWIWNKVADRNSRLQALFLGAALWIGLCLIATLLPGLDAHLSPWATANQRPLTVLGVAIVGLGLGASTAYLLPWAFLPDAIDAQPGHPAGLITAFMVQIQKLGSALSVFALGALLSASGYEASLGMAQPESALVMIRVCIGVLPSGLVMAAIWVMKDWPQPLTPQGLT